MIRAVDVAIEEGREQERARVLACIESLLTAYREKHGGTGEYGLALGDLRMWLEQAQVAAPIHRVSGVVPPIVHLYCEKDDSDPDVCVCGHARLEHAGEHP